MRVMLQAKLRAIFGKALGQPMEEVGVLAEEMERLRVFSDIPCSRCGQPMTPSRDHVLVSFKDWVHVKCPLD